MFSRSPDNWWPAAEEGARDVDPYEEPFIAVQTLRDIAFLRATELAESYSERRAELELVRGGSYAGLVLYARERNDRRSIQLDWMVGHFRQQRLVLSSSIPKRRGAAYDLASLKRKAPAHTHNLIVETELRARVIREALIRLTEADTALKVAVRRLQSASHTDAGAAENDDRCGADDVLS